MLGCSYVWMMRLVKELMKNYKRWILIKMKGLRKMKITFSELKEAILEAMKEFVESGGLKNIKLKTEPEDIYFDLSKLETKEIYGPLIFTEGSSIMAGFDNRGFFQIRQSGNYTNRSFLLSKKYNWEIIEDNGKNNCLVPTKKIK